MLHTKVMHRDGPIDAMHIIEKQTIKRVYSRGAAMMGDAQYRPLRPVESEFLIVDDSVFVPADEIVPRMLRDARNVIPGFRAFHNAFDDKKFKLPVAATPREFGAFVDEFSLHDQAAERVEGFATLASSFRV